PFFLSLVLLIFFLHLLQLISFLSRSIFTMANKTIREFSTPSAANVAIAPDVIDANLNFELKPALITMVQASPFCGKAHEDANAHLQQFLEICGTFTIKGITQEAIRLRLFPFSLLGKAKQWFYTDRSAVGTWDK
ncbi:hypothetical protein EF849_22015, partial [Aeromonas jandaei]|nr:hypothetical protein [Aeromonas jandaei]